MATDPLPDAPPLPDPSSLLRPLMRARKRRSALTTARVRRAAEMLTWGNGTLILLMVITIPWWSHTDIGYILLVALITFTLAIIAAYISATMLETRHMARVQQRQHDVVHLAELEAQAGIPVALDPADPCPKCGKPTVVGARYCTYCKALLQAPPKPPRVCQKCGGRPADDASYCPACGGYVDGGPRPKGADTVYSVGAPPQPPVPPPAGFWTNIIIKTDDGHGRHGGNPYPSDPGFENVITNKPVPGRPNPRAGSGASTRPTPPRLWTQQQLCDYWHKHMGEAPRCPHCQESHTVKEVTQYKAREDLSSIAQTYGQTKRGRARAVCRRCGLATEIAYDRHSGFTPLERLTYGFYDATDTTRYGEEIAWPTPEQVEAYRVQRRSELSNG